MGTLDVASVYLVGVLDAVVCRSSKLPRMQGCLAVGVLIGPTALAFAFDAVSVRYQAVSQALLSTGGLLVGKLLRNIGFGI